MAEKLFNEYYTKRYTLPGRFTAMNGAIQYFELTAGVALDYVAADDSKEEALKEKASQANYLRVLEVLRANGPQPIITYVDGTKLGFTVEQTWAWGERDPLQVSAHYENGKADEESKWNGLKDGAVNDITAFFKGVKALKVDGEEIVDDEETDLFADVEVKTTAGSLNANHA